MILRSAGKDRPYFALAREAAQDEELSWEARGLLCYLVSLPGDWHVSVADLAKRSPSGEGRVRRILRDELIPAGYVVRVQPRGEDGRMLPTEYVVGDSRATAASLPRDGFPHAVKPRAVNRALHKRQVTDKTEDSLLPDGEPETNSAASTKGVRPLAPDDHDGVVALVTGRGKTAGVFEAACAEYGATFVQATRQQREAFARYVESLVAEGTPWLRLREYWQSFVAEAEADGSFGRYVTARTAVDRWRGWLVADNGPNLRAGELDPEW